MGVCSWIFFGFFVGLIARALMPGEQRMGLLKTTVLGVAGAFAGGGVAALLRNESPMQAEPAGFVGSVLGAILLLAISAALSRKRTGA